MASGPRKRRPQASARVSPRLDANERKEKVLHTRVPESLERHLKSRARGLGLSVSTVVRNVLLNTFGLVEDIVTDSTNIALAIAGADSVPRGEVIAWQEVTLNRNAVCDHCNALLRKGMRAAIGVCPDSKMPPIICDACLAATGKPVEGVDPKPHRRSS